MRDQENKSAMCKTNEKPISRIQGTLPINKKEKSLQKKMDKGCEQQFIEGVNLNNQQTYKEMLKLSNIQRNAT